MNKIKDINIDLDKDIDLSNKKQDSFFTEKGVPFKDIDEFLNQNICLHGLRYAKIIKNNFKNISDGLLKTSKKYKDINLNKTNKFPKTSLDFNNYLENKANLKIRENIIKNISKIKSLNLNNIKNINLKDLKIKKDKLRFKKESLKYLKYKKIGLYLLLIFILTFGNKLLLEHNIKKGYNNLIEIKSNITNTDKIKELNKEAIFSLKFSKILYFPFSIIPNNNIENVGYLIDGGLEVTNFIESSLELYSKVNSRLEYIDNKDFSFTDFLSNNENKFRESYIYLYSALVNYSNVGDLGSEDLNNKMFFVKDKLHKTVSFLDLFYRDYNTFLSILSDESTKKYLVLFQNNDEIRSTGGFIGSTALLTLKNGRIINIENKDIYAYEWLINKNYPAEEKDIAPKGLDKITGTFGLRDANYFINTSKSSNQIKTFLEKAEVNIDGIVYINQNTILDILELVDGVDSKIIGEKITKDNFSLIISTLVESKAFKVGTLGTPKQVLFDFGNELKDKIISSNQYGGLIDILVKNIETRDIMFYSFNTKENNFLWKTGINGYINFGETLDFSYPVYTSIGGNKTDRYIKYKYNKTLEKIPGTCEYKTNLNIYNSHLFTKEDDIYAINLLNKYGIKDQRDILNIQGRGVNKSYLRVVLPKNSIIEKSASYEIKNYENFKVVELFTNTEKLQTTNYSINYRLLNKNCINYEYLLYKQPGIKNYNLNLSIDGKDNKYENISKDFFLKKDSF